MMEGDSNVTDNRKGKQKTSVVWAHFTRSKEDTVNCLHCQKTLQLCQGSTSSLLKHLRTRHPTLMTSSNGQQLQSEGLLTDLAVEPKRKGGKEKQSIVWAHFTRSEEDDDVTCLHCKKRLKYSAGSTTSMRNHLKARHPAEMYHSERHRDIAAIAKKNGQRNGKPWKQKMPNAPQQQQTPADVKLTTDYGALESQGSNMESDQSLDDHCESNQLSRQQVEMLLKCLEGKERELAEAYETFQNTVQALREDMETIKEQLTNLTGEHHKDRCGNTVSNKSQHTGPNPFQGKVCEDEPLLSLSCTSEPNSPGYDDAERSQRSSGDQEVTIIGLFTPHTVSASDDKIMDYTYMKAAYASETSAHNPSNSPGSARDTERRPQHLILRTVSVTLQDCRHKLGPDGVFLVHSDEMQQQQEEEDNIGDEDEYVDGGSNDNEVFDRNLKTDPDYNPEENYDIDENSEKFFQKSGRTKSNHQAFSLHAKQQHPVSPLQEAPPTEERPFKCPKCDHSYKFCSDFIQHLKTHGVGLQPLRPHSRLEIDDDGDGDDNPEMNSEHIPENADNIEDDPESM